MKTIIINYLIMFKYKVKYYLFYKRREVYGKI